MFYGGEDEQPIDDYDDPPACPAYADYPVDFPVLFVVWICEKNYSDFWNDLFKKNCIFNIYLNSGSLRHSARQHASAHRQILQDDPTWIQQ